MGTGEAGDTSIALSITSGGGFPSAQITSYPEGVVTPGTLVTLTGVATDPEDGDLSGAQLEWFADLDGLLGTGSPLEVALSGPAVPCHPETVLHMITFRATDSSANEAEDQVEVVVGFVCYR